MHRILLDRNFTREHLSVSRTLCGALVYPSIASLTGRLFFQRIPSSLQRTILVSAYYISEVGVVNRVHPGSEASLSLNAVTFNTTEWQ